METSLILQAITALVSITGISISIVTSFVVYRKMAPEIKGIDASTGKTIAETSKISAETIASYATELKSIKEENLQQQAESKKERQLLNAQIEELRVEINNIKDVQDRERRLYNRFISELLFGITRLVGQIQMSGETPIWTPPAKTPLEFDSLKGDTQ